MTDSVKKANRGAARAVPEPCAIIGMACIFPQAPDVKAFWENILGAVDAIGDPVASWDAQRYLDAGSIKTPSGGYLKDLYRFDPREFGIMPNSLDGGEPDQFLALKVARDALLDAGYMKPDYDHSDTGIILGHSTYLHRGQGTLIQNHIVLDQTMELLGLACPTMEPEQLAEVRKLLKARLPQATADIAPGLVPNVMTGRIANRLNLKGPNYLIDAACSSSLLAVNAAMDELQSGRSRLMLAGGVNASLPAEVAVIFTQLGALSGRGKVRPFEAGSDGTLLGEGLGIVAMKRLSDAIADGDRVYAVVRGIGQASDGRGLGLLAPSVDGETLSIRRAYQISGVDPASIGLIEAHGTGIPLGDKTEIASLKNVFGDRQGEHASVALGSVKSMISHCIPAAGMAGLIKSALALHHKVLPPTLCDKVNPELGFDSSPFYVNTQTRPWISAPGTPRRAGVDSFGFGGINTHAILEEAPLPAQRPRQMTPWPAELCIVSADSSAALSVKLEQLAASIAARPERKLAEVAAALAAADARAQHRIAFIAKDLPALAKSVGQAIKKLGDKPADRWSIRGSVVYSQSAIEGKLAFLFPGEGSQYLEMFADLALCFDEVQAWLDFWRGIYDDAPGNTRTDIAFPSADRNTPEGRKELEGRLNGMDVGSEAVFVGGQAMNALLRSLGVEPDVMVGHSSGESAALAASGAIASETPAQLAGFVRQLNTVYRQILADGDIPTGALLAVGAMPLATVEAKIAEVAKGVVVAMDNCANQVVLFGQPAEIEALQKALSDGGGICLPLPFDRGYHTPAFARASAEFLKYYKAIRVGRPSLPLYSCASAELFPEGATAVRQLAASQWSNKVRFTETIRRMHADGVRHFIEVGPSGNLTAFVNDILAGTEYVSLATNIRRRNGVEQLLTVLAHLFTNRKEVGIDKLFSRRAIASVDLAKHDAVPRYGVLLDNTMPMMRLTDADRSRLQSLTAAPAAEPLPTPPAPVAPAASPLAIEPAYEMPETAAVDPKAQVMAEYFDVMRGFLDQQRGVVEGWQSHEPQVAEAAVAAPALEDATGFIQTVVELDEQHIAARCQVSLIDDNFIRHHVLSGRVSESDPDLWGLSCVPMMVSIEMMAEACAVLAGTTDLCVIENIRAFDWIALDDGELTLDVHAQVVDRERGLFRAQVRNGANMAVSGDFLFQPEWKIGGLAPLSEHRVSRWNKPNLYTTGMFHGPVFQSIDSIDGWDDAGIDAQLSEVSLHGFFEEGRPTRMVLNPVLLDAMGQLAAYWIAQYAGTDFNCFPSTIERVELYRPCPADLPGLVLRARQHAVDPKATEVSAPRAWQFECLDADGQPLVRVSNLLNIYFPVPNRFYQVRRDPLGGWLGQPSHAAAKHGVVLWDLPNFADDFSAQSGGIFLRILAHAILSFEERDEWRALPPHPRRRREWLLGRAAIKEGVRHWVHEQTGHLLYPSDIVVLHDENGAPYVDGGWRGTLIDAPEVSLSHNARTCLAAIASPGYAVGVDVEDFGRIQQPDLITETLTPSERSLVSGLTGAALDERLLRLWCAKEAAAKFLGCGFQGRPEAFVVRFSDDNGSHAWVDHEGTVTAVDIIRDGDSIIAVATDQHSGVEVH